MRAYPKSTRMGSIERRHIKDEEHGADAVECILVVWVLSFPSVPPAIVSVRGSVGRGFDGAFDRCDI